MSLEAELVKRRRQVAGVVSAGDQRTVTWTIERNRMLQLAEQSLEVGDTLPDFLLPDPSGRRTSSDELLDRGPVVLAFFRGGWCPYCDATLRALEAARPGIEAPAPSWWAWRQRNPRSSREPRRRGAWASCSSATPRGPTRSCAGFGTRCPRHTWPSRRMGIDLAARHGGAG
jgi:hypothetical protein